MWQPDNVGHAICMSVSRTSTSGSRVVLESPDTIQPNDARGNSGHDCIRVQDININPCDPVR